jgi:predicted RNase H-like HicB family nuclease
MAVKLYLEVDSSGHAMAHALDLVGCFDYGLSKDEAVAKMPETVREYLAWTRRHGEPLTVLEPISVEVMETVRGTCPRNSGDAAALFKPEKQAVTEEMIATTIRRMGYAREDLLELVRGLPDEVMDWKREERMRSIREILTHVARCDWRYVTRLTDEDPPASEPPGDVFLFLKQYRESAVKRLLGLPEKLRAGVYHPKKNTKHPEEPWSARKVIRRYVEHEREHIDNITQRLAEHKRRKR